MTADTSPTAARLNRHLNDCHTDTVRDDAPGDGGRGLVFWWLIAMAVVGFAPCMILPAWREYQVAELNERISASQVAVTTAKVDHLRRRLHAVHNDPAVVARLAQRELEFRKPGESAVVIPVSGPTMGGALAVRRNATKGLEPVQPPVPVARLLAYIPNLNYDRLFCESPMREIILTMSVLLFVAAFIIFRPRGSADEPVRPDGLRVS